MIRLLRGWAPFTGVARWARRHLRLLLMAGVPAVFLLVGAYVYLTSGRYVSTENAYVKAEVASLSAEVSGRVVEVVVEQHEIVRPGQVLFRLDAEPFRLALRSADAHLADVRRQTESLRTSYRAQEADLAAAEDNVAYLKREYERRNELTSRGVSTQEQLAAAQHAYRSAVLKAQVQREDLKRLLAQLGGDPDLPVESYPGFQAALAAREQAAWNLERTAVKAPIAGIVGQEPPVVGDYVRLGVPVLAVVGMEPWVEANLKETELTHVHPGQRATVTVDAYPGYTWQAEVTSISPATGAEFSLLPPQNASGNWVKVVQRLPVRLILLAASPAPPLHSGMSASVVIDTQYRHQWLSMLDGVLGRPATSLPRAP